MEEDEDEVEEEGGGEGEVPFDLFLHSIGIFEVRRLNKRSEDQNERDAQFH